MLENLLTEQEASLPQAVGKGCASRDRHRVELVLGATNVPSQGQRDGRDGCGSLECDHPDSVQIRGGFFE